MGFAGRLDRRTGPGGRHCSLYKNDKVKEWAKCLQVIATIDAKQIEIEFITYMNTHVYYTKVH